MDKKKKKSGRKRFIIKMPRPPVNPTYPRHTLLCPRQTAMPDTPLAQFYSCISLQWGGINSSWGIFPVGTLFSAGQKKAETWAHWMK
jgi:hypothetical protein